MTQQPHKTWTIAALIKNDAMTCARITFAHISCNKLKTMTQTFLIHLCDTSQCVTNHQTRREMSDEPRCSFKNASGTNANILWSANTVTQLVYHVIWHGLHNLRCHYNLRVKGKLRLEVCEHIRCLNSSEQKAAKWELALGCNGYNLGSLCC